MEIAKFTTVFIFFVASSSSSLFYFSLLSVPNHSLAPSLFCVFWDVKYANSFYFCAALCLLLVYGPYFGTAVYSAVVAITVVALFTFGPLCLNSNFGSCRKSKKKKLFFFLLLTMCKRVRVGVRRFVKELVRNQFYRFKWSGVASMVHAVNTIVIEFGILNVAVQTSTYIWWRLFYIPYSIHTSTYNVIHTLVWSLRLQYTTPLHLSYDVKYVYRPTIHIFICILTVKCASFIHWK